MTSASLFKLTVALLAIPTVLVLAIASLMIFLMLGGGWAYGTAGCHFEMNVFGMAMVAGAALGLVIFLYAVGRQLIRTHAKVLSPR